MRPPYFYTASSTPLGTAEKDATQFRIRSYEAGVLLVGGDGGDGVGDGGGGGGGAAAAGSASSDVGGDRGGDGPRLASAQHPFATGVKGRTVPLPYDLPLTKYTADEDEMWMWDKPHSRPDSIGCTHGLTQGGGGGVPPGSRNERARHQRD